LPGCATARNQGTCGKLASIGRDERESAALDGLQHRLMDPAQRESSPKNTGGTWKNPARITPDGLQ
jgi:hypothetical protein